MSEECVICFEDLSADEIYTLNCKHCFHRDCITRWLHNNPSCPLCRQPVDADFRYVNDGIMSEEQRRHIEELRTVSIALAKGLEWVFPTHIQGFTRITRELLQTEEGREFLVYLAETYDESFTVSWLARIIDWFGWNST